MHLLPFQKRMFELWQTPDCVLSEVYLKINIKVQSKEYFGTYFSISFLAFLLSKSILVMMLICGISKDIIALSAARIPEINLRNMKNYVVKYKIKPKPPPHRALKPQTNSV